MSDLAAGKGPRRGFRPLRLLAILILLAIAGLFIGNAVDVPDPTAALPPRFDAYASVGSVSSTVTRLAGLRAFDVLLGDPALAAFRGALLGVRSDRFLSSLAFRVLANRPARVVALDGSFIAAVDLGPLGCAARLLPFGSTWLATRGIDYRFADGTSRAALGAPGHRILLALRGRLLLVSTSVRLIDEALRRAVGAGATVPGPASDAAAPASLAARAAAEGLSLDPPAPGVIRILVSGDRLAGQLESGGSAPFPLLSGISFPRDCAIDLDLSNERVAIDARIPLKSSDSGFAALFDHRSSVPAILSVLPASTEYLSAISESSLKDLHAASKTFLGPEGEAAYSRAENACRAALGMGFDEALYSWAGGELGVFGLSGSDQPVFFVHVSDESARRLAFQKLFAGAVLGSDDSTVVDGMRISRLVIPWYVKDLLALAGADLPEPYWIDSGGFVFVSNSAENLALVAGVSKSGESLPRAQTYQAVMKGTGADALALVYYSLDRSLPFFLRGSGSIERILRLYGRGLLLVHSDGTGSIGFSLRAVSSGPKPAVVELPGFPFKAGGRLAGPPVAVGSGSGLSILLPLDGGRVVTHPLGGGGPAEQRLDAQADLVAVPTADSGAMEGWALTRAGTIYRFGPRLEEKAPFPLATGYRPSSPPAPMPAYQDRPGGIAFGVKEGGFVTVTADGKVTKIELPGEPPLLAPPVFAEGWTALYAKSFDGRLHLLDAQGKEAPGWPVQIDGIGYGSPFFVRAARGLALGFLTQAGRLTLCGLDGLPLPGFPLSLDGVFYHAPVALAGHIYALSTAGSIFHISPEGGLIGRSPQPLLASEASYLQPISAGQGPRSLMLALGSGNALYAYSANLEGIPGFPVPGALSPFAVDLDGDGAADILVGGIDDQVHAYGLR